MPEHFPLFIFCKTSHTSCSCCHPPLQPTPLQLPLFLKSCIYILLRCGSPSQSCSTATLRRRLLPSCSSALSPVWRIIKTHLQCCWSWPDLHTHTVCLSLPSLWRREKGRERKRQNISDRTTADSEGEKKGSKHWWAERRRLSSFTHPS